MRKVVVSEFLTLDGIMEAPNEWSFPYWNDQIAKVKFDELFASDALLLGRVTYEGFAAAWPGRTDEQGFGDRINNMAKYVASTTLTKLEWTNSHLLEGDVASAVAKLKEQPGQDILIAGSAKLVHTLMQHDLIDVYQLLVYPLNYGKGKRLFNELPQSLKLKLVKSEGFSSGVVLLTYERER